MCCQCPLLGKWDPGLSFTKQLFSLYCLGKAFDSNGRVGSCKVLAKHIRKMGRDANSGRRRHSVACWPSGAHQLCSPRPLASWAQVAPAHYSNPHGLSFTGKEKYRLLASTPPAALLYSRGSRHEWEAATKRQPGKLIQSQLCKRKKTSTFHRLLMEKSAPPLIKQWK